MNTALIAIGIIAIEFAVCLAVALFEAALDDLCDPEPEPPRSASTEDPLNL